MTNTPLNSRETTKLVVFFIFLFVLCLVYGIGFLPFCFLVIGCFLTKAKHDFSYIEIWSKFYRIYLKLFIYVTLLGGLVFALFSVWFHKYLDALAAGMSCFLFVLPCFLYLYMCQKFFLIPLRAHKDWVAENGIFSGRPQTNRLEKVTSLNLEELRKLQIMREENLVTQEELIKLRNRLLDL